MQVGMQVGIDAIGLALPPLSLELASLARARNVEPSKYIDGLGTSRISIPPVDEDTVTLAVRAARSALERAGVSPSEIGLCVVGTETAVDHSKPVTAFVHGLLGLPSSCRIYETKHACYGATAGLQTALDWIRAGSARGKKALIIGADIARYGLRTPGEPTQGAGAVALLVSESPRLVAFETGKVGTFAHDVNDFWRPLYSKDAVVDGHYSVTCYLDALEGAYRAYLERSGDVRDPNDATFSDRFAAIAYHVPYGKMATKAHRHLRGLEGDTDPAKSFERQVASGLVLPRLVGNIYTGSLYLSLASVLSESRVDLSGKPIALFSYGSGSCAELFSGVVQPGAQDFALASGWRKLIDAQRMIDVAEYESIMNEREAMDTRATADAAPVSAEGPTSARFVGVKDHKRIYAAS
jgi:hydroxymethylglutaryl-CoA synthase